MMQRTIEGWLIMLFTAPILLWGITQICSLMVSLMPIIPFEHRWTLPSLPELVFLGVFTVPTAVSAYHYVTQVDEAKRRTAKRVMFIGPVLLYLLQLVDNAVGRPFIELGLQIVRLVSIASYLLITLYLARAIVRWQETHG